MILVSLANTVHNPDHRLPPLLHLPRLHPLSLVLQAAILSPDKKSDREYTPKLADAIRAPTLDDALAPDAGLPPVGDLFSAVPQLPAYLQANVGAPGAPKAAPQLPDWNAKRPFLTGRFLLEGAVEQQQQQGSSGGGSKAGGRGNGVTGAAATAAQVLESYPPSVQESLREWPPQRPTLLLAAALLSRNPCHHADSTQPVVYSRPLPRLHACCLPACLPACSRG